MTAKPSGRIEPEAIFLDPWLTTKGDPLATLAEDLMSIVQPQHQGRVRLERRDAIHNRHLCVSNIVANLALLALSPNLEPGNLLAISTAKTAPSRYDRADYPRHLLAELLVALEAGRMLKRYPHVFRQRSTTVEPTAEFIALMQRHGVRLGDIGREVGGETIWLNARSEEEPLGNQPIPKCLVTYQDTGETVRLRAEIDRVSTFLNASGIAYDGDPAAPVTLRRMFLLRSPFDPPSFSLNGRLAGGFWMSLKSNLRHLITLGGEDILDLDFKGMFAALAYLKVTGSLPQGDPYDIPGLEQHRKGAKLALLSLLARSSSMRRLTPELKAALPEGWTSRQLVEAVTRRHPEVAPCFGKDLGVELMGTESRLLIALLLELETKGIPALPMHDGINVPVSARETAIKAMETVSKRLLGVVLPVAEKPIWRPTAWPEAA